MYIIALNIIGGVLCFAKPPQKGDKVKVYVGQDGRQGTRYGIVESVVTGRDRTERGRARQIAMLRPCGKLNHNEIDYWLDEYKVSFV